MPMMDMRVALLDAYTLDSFSVIRRVEVVNDLGESVLTPSTMLNVRGVVTPAAPSALERQANMQIAPKWIDIILLTRLYPESESGAKTEYQPDWIVWNGNNYVVKTLSDYSNWGPGFVQAGCALIDSQQTPPGNGN